MAKRQERVPIEEVRRRRARDLFLIGLSLYVAYGIMYTGVVTHWIDSVHEYAVLGSFAAGIFFTSLFTLAPAVAALLELSQSLPWSLVVIPGALGAVVGDLILFLFLRDVVITNVAEIVPKPLQRSWRGLLRYPLMRWIVPAIGLIFYTLPFMPDEVGLALMGLSRTRIAILIPLTFVVNIVGISIVWYGVHAIAS